VKIEFLISEFESEWQPIVTFKILPSRNRIFHTKKCHFH